MLESRSMPSGKQTSEGKLVCPLANKRLQDQSGGQSLENTSSFEVCRILQYCSDCMQSFAVYGVVI
jgi:hypothetical protein